MDSNPYRRRPYPAPKGKYWARRHGEWVLIDIQVVRWRDRNKRRAQRAAKEASKVIPKKLGEMFS